MHDSPPGDSLGPDECLVVPDTDLAPEEVQREILLAAFRNSPAVSRLIRDRAMKKLGWDTP